MTLAGCSPWLLRQFYKVDPRPKFATLAITCRKVDSQSMNIVRCKSVRRNPLLVIQYNQFRGEMRETGSPPKVSFGGVLGPSEPNDAK